jgi:hypothetical protein
MHQRPNQERGPWHRDHADLPELSQHIKCRPVFGHFPVFDAEHLDT